MYRPSIILFFSLGLFILGNGSSSGQCDLKLGLTEVEKKYANGFFNQVLEHTEALLDCSNLSTQQFIDLQVWTYKAYRNTRKSRKAHNAILAAAAMFQQQGQVMSFDFQFLLAESYARRGDRDNYELHIQRIRDSLIPMTEPVTLDQARYHLVEYYAYDKKYN